MVFDAWLKLTKFSRRFTPLQLFKEKLISKKENFRFYPGPTEI